MARTNKNSNRTVDKMMLDGGSTSNLTSHNYEISNSKSAHIPITLASDYKITGTARGTGEVNCKTDDGDMQTKLLNTIVVLSL